MPTACHEKKPEETWTLPNAVKEIPEGESSLSFKKWHRLQQNELKIIDRWAYDGSRASLEWFTTVKSSQNIPSPVLLWQLPSWVKHWNVNLLFCEPRFWISVFKANEFHSIDRYSSKNTQKWVWNWMPGKITAIKKLWSDKMKQFCILYKLLICLLLLSE